MQKPASLLLFFVLLLMICPEKQASAQLLLDQTIQGTIGGGTELEALSKPHPSSVEVIQKLQSQGYTAIAPLAAGSNQYFATTPEGMNVLLTIDPTTGGLIGATPR